MAQQTKCSEEMRGGAVFPEAGFMRLPQVLKFFPVSRSTWFLMIREGRAPKPVKLSRRCSAWRVSDIRAMIEGRK